MAFLFSHSWVIGLIVVLLLVLPSRLAVSKNTPRRMESASGTRGAASTSKLIDLVADPNLSRLPLGFSISNSTLQFGEVEVFTTTVRTILLEWPSPPGTEAGQAGVAIETWCSDESVISFVPSVIFNDGVKSSTTLTVHYHPQTANETSSSGFDTVVIDVGSVVTFRLAAYGRPAPSAHKLEPLFVHGQATLLHPFDAWVRTIEVWNPTNAPYVIHSHEVSHKSMQLLFVDQNDQVDPQRKSWVIEPSSLTQKSTVLGSLSVVGSEEGRITGFFYLRMRSGLTFAMFFNFTVQPLRARAVSLGTHTVFLSSSGSTFSSSTDGNTNAAQDRDDAADAEDDRSDNDDDSGRLLQRQSEMVLWPIELSNYQTKPQRVLDVVVVRTQPQRVTTATHRPTVTLRVRPRGPQETTAVVATGTAEQLATGFAPCVRLVPQFGASVAPGSRGLVAVAVMNLTQCLWLNPTSGRRGEPPFATAQRLSIDVRVILSDRDYDQREMGLVLTGWVLAGGLLPLRSRQSHSSSKSSASRSYQRLEGPFALAVPTNKMTAVEPLDLYVLNSYAFALRETDVSLHPNGIGVSVTPSPGWGTTDTSRTSMKLLHLGKLAVDTTTLRKHVAPAAYAVSLLLTVPILPRTETLSCAGRQACLPETVEWELPIVLLLKPLVLTLDDRRHDGLRDDSFWQDCPLARTWHPNARASYCKALANPVTTLHFGIHSAPKVATAAHNGAAGVGPHEEVVRSILIRVTNPHNITAHLLEWMVSPNLTQSGRKQKTHPFVRLAPQSLRALEQLAVESERHYLPPGESVFLELQLVCDALHERCASNGLHEGLFTLRVALRLAGRTPVVQELSTPVAFALLEEARTVISQPPMFEWNDRVAMQVEPDLPETVMVMERNITLHAFLSSSISLPPPSCFHIFPGSSEISELHPSFDITWSLPVIPKGYFEGPVATVRYFPTRRVPADHSTQQVRSVCASATSSLVRNHGILQSTSGVPHGADLVQWMEACSTSIGQHRQAAAVSAKRTVAPHTAAFSSASLSDSEIEHFIRDVTEHEQLQHCRFSFFPPSIGPSTTSPSALDSWTTLLTGQQGRATLVTEVVDFGALSNSNSTRKEVFVRLVNTQATTVVVKPLLWSSSNSKISPVMRNALRDAVRLAFNSFRSAAAGDSGGSSGSVGQLRDRASAFRIPDDVWDRPSTTFSLQGNATSPITIPPFAHVWIGPVVYQPSSVTNINGAVVERDILLLRNNDSHLDAVLMVGKVGRPTIHFGSLGDGEWGVRELPSGAVQPLPGAALADIRGALSTLNWNVHRESMNAWLPRASGYPSWLDLWHHYRFAGTQTHTAELLERVPGEHQDKAALLVQADTLRQFVVRGEFSSSGDLVSLGESARNSADKSTKSNTSSVELLRGLPSEVRARLPVFFETHLQIINKGSYLLNLTSVVLRGGACSDGEWMIYPCIAQNREAAELPSAWALIAQVLRSASYGSRANETSESTTFVIIPPRSALQVSLLRMPQFFVPNVTTELWVSQSGSQAPVRFPLRSSIPSERLAEFHFTTVKTVRETVIHLLWSTLLLILVVVSGWNVMRMWRLAALTQPSLIATTPLPPTNVATPAAAAATALNSKVPASAALAAPSKGGAGTTKAQLLAAKKARRDAWELYHNQQKLHAQRSRNSSGLEPADDSTTSPAMEYASDDENATTPQRSQTPSSHASSTPSNAANRNIAVPPIARESPASLAAAGGGAFATPAEHQGFEALRVLRSFPREMHDLTEAEHHERDRIVTDRLAFIGKTLLEWNASPQVLQFHEIRALERLQQQARAQSAAAEEAARAKQERLEHERRKQEAEARRRQAEENVRRSEREDRERKDNRRVVLPVTVAAASAPPSNPVVSASTKQVAAAVTAPSLSPAAVEKEDKQRSVRHQKLERVHIAPSPADEGLPSTLPLSPPLPPPSQPRQQGPVSPLLAAATVASVVPSIPSVPLLPPEQQQPPLQLVLRRAAKCVSPLEAPGPSETPPSAPVVSAALTPVTLSEEMPTPVLLAQSKQRSGSFQAPSAIGDDTLDIASGGGVAAVSGGLAPPPHMKSSPSSFSQTYERRSWMAWPQTSPLTVPDGIASRQRHEVHAAAAACATLSATPRRSYPAAVDDVIPSRMTAAAISSGGTALGDSVSSVDRGIMGRALNRTPEELLAARLPSDITFEDAPAPALSSGAAVGDYNAFFGLQLQDALGSSTTSVSSARLQESVTRLGTSPVLGSARTVPARWSGNGEDRRRDGDADPLSSTAAAAAPAFNVFQGTW